MPFSNSNRDKYWWQDCLVRGFYDAKDGKLMNEGMKFEPGYKVGYRKGSEERPIIIPKIEIKPIELIEPKLKNNILPPLGSTLNNYIIPKKQGIGIIEPIAPIKSILPKNWWDQ